MAARTNTELLERIATLKKANRSLERFAQIVAHDMRGAAGSVNGFLYLLGQALDAGDVEQARVYARRAKATSDHLAGFVDAIFGFLGLSKREIVVEPVFLPTALETARGLVADLLSAGTVTIDVSATPNVQAQKTLLVTLLQNLLANAAQYRHPDRPLRVSVDSAATATGWEISVRDNGLGIPEEHLALIFKPFHRVEGRVQGGNLGLGLALCRRIAELHGGDIAVNSTLGQGTSFTVSLRDGDAPSRPTGLPRLLCVEDDPLLRDSLVRLLSRTYSVTAVDCAEHALDLLDYHAFAGVLTDQDLPGKTGLELCEIVREKHPGAWCAVLTGATQRLDAPDTLMVMYKPVSAETLLSRLAVLAEGHATKTDGDPAE